MNKADVKIQQAIAKEVRKKVEMTKNPDGRSPRKAIDELLDGEGQAAKPGQEVVTTRQSWCAQHGDYVDQQIKLKCSDADYRPYVLPYWLGCPKCREAWEAGNKAEARFMKSVNMLNRWR